MNRTRVTAACAVCGAVLWDEPLGMIVSFPGVEQAREELPRDWGWTVAVLPGGAELVLCPGCVARLAPRPSARNQATRQPEGGFES